MGIGESKVSPGPKIFFLVFGGPKITYRRGVDQGPLIFNVEPMERRIEPPASAETRKCPIYCSGKQPFKLVRTANGNDSWRLNFSIDSASVPFKLKIYAGTILDYEHANGFGIKKATANQGQFVVADEYMPAGNNIPFNAAHLPLMLKGLDTTTGAGNPDEVFTRLSASPLVIEMTCDGIREGDAAGATKTQLFIFLTFNKSDLEEGAERRDFIPAACVKQYIFSQGELFESDDVFDLRGDDAAAPTSPDTANPDAPAEEVEADDDVTCVVCLTNERNTTIIPCRHMCVCAECAGLLQQNSGKCPMCRREIQKLLTLAV